MSGTSGGAQTVGQATTLAKRLIRCEFHGELALDVSQAGTPSTHTLPIASALDGRPLISLEPGGQIGERVAETQRVSLTLGLEHRLCLSCTAERVQGDLEALARARFSARHGRTEHEGDITVLTPQTATLSSGAREHVLDVAKLVATLDRQLLQLERRAVDHMNEDHRDAIKLYAEVLLNEEKGDWRLASLDMDGLDLTCGDRFARLWFDPPLQEAGDIKSRLVELAMKARS
ncbi:MAG: DUF2470 domain-containing protein [Pseudomonadota bacterium]